MQNTGLFGIGGNAINGGGALPPNMGERPSGNGRKTNN
jgi:hypothetical protein